MRVRPKNAKEIARNDAVYSYQGNRNPFIDHPEWVDCLFSDVCGGGDTTGAPETTTDAAAITTETGGATTALVIGSEILSRVTNWEDRSTAVLFGDGAGAVILQASEEPGIIATHIHSDGKFEDLLEVRPHFGLDATTRS